MSRLYDLFYEIITSLHDIYIKIKKLNNYWYAVYQPTLSLSGSMASGYTLVTESSYAYIVNNILLINITYRRTGAQINSGTSVKVKIGTFTITSNDNASLNELIAGSFYSTSCCGASAGPIVTYCAGNPNRTDSNTITFDFFICGTAGGAIAQSTTTNLMARFFCPCVRKLKA